MQKENKGYLDRAKEELNKIRKAIKTAETQRNNLNKSIRELKELEKNFVYLIEDVEGVA